MRVVSVQTNNGLLAITAVRKEEGQYTLFTVEEAFDRDTMTIQPIFTNRTEEKPVSDADKAILHKILQVVSDDYEIRPASEDDEAEKETEQEAAE